MELARDIIERRVAGIGVSEPQVRTETAGDGSRRIVVEVPGVSDEDQVRELVGSTGQLQFIDPQGQQLTDDQDIRTLLEDGHGPRALQRRPDRAGQRRPPTSARATRSASRSPSRPEGSQIWCEFTTANVEPPGTDRARRPGHHDPDDRGPDLRGTARSSRSAPPRRRTRSSARTSTTRCASARCRVSLTERAFDDVDPTLGADFLVQALVAGGVGLLLVLFFMIAYYRLPGVLAAIALVFYTLVVYAIFRLIHVTLTLAGVAAFILSHRHGGRRQHPHLRAHEGGDPGRQDAGPGDRGRLQPRLVEHPRLERQLAPRRRLALLAGHDRGRGLRARPDHRRAGQHVQRGRPSRAPCCGTSPARAGAAGSSSTTWSARPMYDIVGKRNLWFAISAILTIPGLLFIFLGGLKPSIDFTGGTEWEVRYADEPTAGRDDGGARRARLSRCGRDRAARRVPPDPNRADRPHPAAGARRRRLRRPRPPDRRPHRHRPARRAVGQPQRSGRPRERRPHRHRRRQARRPEPTPRADRRGHRVRRARGASSRTDSATGRSPPRAHGRPDHRRRAHPHARPS